MEIKAVDTGGNRDGIVEEIVMASNGDVIVVTEGVREALVARSGTIGKGGVSKKLVGGNGVSGGREGLVCEV